MQPLDIKGNNFEIGRLLGNYWGSYFDRIKRKKLFSDYEGWLARTDTKKNQLDLLLNTVKYFPALLDELRGMVFGINESSKYLKASLPGLFSCWLAETDLSHEEYNGSPTNGCSSMILPLEDGYFLAHSDEFDAQYPLVVANVSLEANGSVKTFVSISHPFQPFGSAVGMNAHFAFQGNSIGCSKQLFRKIQNNPGTRIPKTIFSREILEMTSLDELYSFYNKYQCSLPNHQFIVFADNALSMSIMPTEDTEAQLVSLSRKIYFHTNHFNDDYSQKFEYEDKNESRERLRFMRNIMADAQSPDLIKERFITFLKQYPESGPKLIRSTSGVFFFTVRKSKRTLCEATLFNSVAPKMTDPVEISVSC